MGASIPWVRLWITAAPGARRADVRRGTPDGHAAGGDNQVLPISWSDNYVTLWPGQSQTLTARYRASDLRGASPVVSLTGRNLPDRTIPAG